MSDIFLHFYGYHFGLVCAFPGRQVKIKDYPEKERPETCSIPDARGASDCPQPRACGGLTPAPHTQGQGSLQVAPAVLWGNDVKTFSVL